MTTVISTLASVQMFAADGKAVDYCANLGEKVTQQEYISACTRLNAFTKLISAENKHQVDLGALQVEMRNANTQVNNEDPKYSNAKYDLAQDLYEYSQTLSDMNSSMEDIAGVTGEIRGQIRVLKRMLKVK